MIKRTRFYLAAAACFAAGGALAGRIAVGKTTVSWDDVSLRVESALFSRAWEGRGGRFENTSFRLKPGGAELLRGGGDGKAERIQVSAKRAHRSAVGEAGVQIKVSGKFGAKTLWVFESAAGVLEEGEPGAKGTPVRWGADRDAPTGVEGKGGGGARAEFGKTPGSSAYRFAARHVRFAVEKLVDRTDGREELRFPREWLLSPVEGLFEGRGCAWAAEDALTGDGVAFLRLSPLPGSRPDRRARDWCVLGRERGVEVEPSAYATWSVAYRGGARGRTWAWHSMQRAMRTYRPGRDGLLASNTWGDRNRDLRINEEFMLKEVEAGAKLGVDAIQIDDGWQKGRSANSGRAGTGRKVWDGYWAADPEFWKPDPARFPGGLEKVAAAAKAKGMSFGLWFGPDSSNDAANWERDADHLTGLWAQCGARHFKIDSMKSHSPLALGRQRAFFDKMLYASQGDMTFDLDVTAEVRPGYFGLPDIGTIFVENRYTDWVRYWPHQTLRNLWQLAHVADPVRLRMEFLNPLRNREKYGDDPLAPAAYPAATLFAAVMTGSPLAWFENTGLAEETAAEFGKIIAVWKRERDAYLTGRIMPVGEAPDGVAWTGFASDCGGGDGYVLAFRELNGRGDWELDLAGLIDGAGECEAIAGGGSAKLEGGKLKILINRKLDFLWVKIKGKKTHDKQEKK